MDSTDYAVSYTIETMHPDWGWQTEQAGFSSREEAEREARRTVYPFWPSANVRIVCF